MGQIRLGVVVTLFLLCMYVPESFSQTLWNDLGTPNGPLVLTMGGTDTSMFLTSSPVTNPFFEWFNNSTSTSQANQASPALSLCGTFYANENGNNQDCWTIQNNTSSKVGLTFAHNGQTYQPGGGVQFDQTMNTLTMYGQLAIWRSQPTGSLPSQTFIAMQEGANVPTAASFDFMGAFDQANYPNARFTGMGIAHGNGLFYPVASIPVAPTAGDCVEFSTYPTTDPRHWPLLVDSGVPCGTLNVVDSSGNAGFAGTLSAASGKAGWNSAGVQTTDANLITAGNGHGIEIVNASQTGLDLPTKGTVPIQMGSTVIIKVDSPGWYRIVPEVVLTTAGSGATCNAGAVQLKLSYTQGVTGASYAIPSWPMWNVASSSTVAIGGTMTISNNAVGSSTDWIPARPMEIYSSSDILLTLNDSVLSNCGTPPVVSLLYRVEAM